MKLYYAPASCSLAAHIALREAGLDFEPMRVDLRDKSVAGGGDLRDVTPKGYVPALQLDDGTVLTEVPAVLQFIADQRPAAGLAPPYGSLERYRLQEWLAYLSSEVHKTWSALWYKDRPAEERARTLERLGGRLDLVAASLGEKPSLLGEAFTVADAYLFALLNWARYTGVDLAKWPNLQAFQARVAARPAVHEALVAERLSRR
jgi:glutathione S-transferase